MKKHLHRRRNKLLIVAAITIAAILVLLLLGRNKDSVPSTQSNPAMSDTKLTLIDRNLPEGWKLINEIKRLEPNATLPAIGEIDLYNATSGCSVSVLVQDLPAELRGKDDATIRRYYLDQDLLIGEKITGVSKLSDGSIEVTTSKGPRSFDSQFTKTAYQFDPFISYREFAVLPRNDSSVTTVSLSCPHQTDLLTTYPLIKNIRIPIKQ